MALLPGTLGGTALGDMLGVSDHPGAGLGPTRLPV